MRRILKIMFKEIADNIKSLTQPVLELPSFVDNRNKPYELIMLLSQLYGTSQDSDRYIKILQTENDMIYVLYRGLWDEINRTIVYDNLVYHGKMCQISVIDYDTIVNDRTYASLLLLLIAVGNAVSFAKAKYAHMFYHSADKLQCLFTEAIIFIFIEVILSVFSDTDELRDSAVKAIQKYGEKMDNYFSAFDAEGFKAYVDLLRSMGLENILDNSMVVLSIKSDGK